MSAKIISTGSYLPATKISNQSFESILDTNDAWIQQRTGIQNRHFETESTTHMAVEAAKKAMQNIDYETIDCIIVGTYTPDYLIPSVASSIQKVLDIKRSIPSFDVNAACSSFIFAMHTAHAFLKAGIYKRILVVGVDFNSKTLDFTDRSTSILFGDGAGAVVIEACNESLFDSIIHSQSDKQDVLTLENSSDYTNPFVTRNKNIQPYFQMKGSEVFKFAVSALSKGVKEILQKNQCSMDDIDYVIAHQANQRILEAGAKILKTDASKFVMNLQQVANTSSASIPLLLDEMNQKSLLKKKMKIIMIGFGGGLSYGSILLEWA